MDHDKNGFLTEEEILSAGYGLTKEDMKALDRNRDGRISRAELDDAVKKASALSHRDALEEEIEISIGGIVPLERQQMRLEGFEPYILVSVLTAQGSFDLITEIPNVKWDNIEEMISQGLPVVQVISSIDWLSIALVYFAAFSTVTGIYATIVFSLTILYGKTAMGTNRDEEYYQFMDATGLQRFRGFQAFSYSLLGFSMAVLLLVAQRSPPPLRIPWTVASVVILYLGVQEYDKIVLAARPIFISSDNNNDNIRS
jgi:hypothetical protein